MAAITQRKYGLWSRRYGSFTGKIETDDSVPSSVTVRVGAAPTTSATQLGAPRTDDTIRLT